MKFNSANLVVGALMGATMLLGVASCSDDHYDIKNGAASANNTIWQNLQANPAQFSDVCSILSKVRVYTSEEDKKRTMTYAELLNQSQSLSFWAPKNGSFDPQPYLARIDEINNYRQQKLNAKADTLEYNLGMQFAQNHLARFNFESNKGDQDVRLYNSKLCTYNAAEGLFNGVKEESTTIPSSNGMLHILDGVSPFAFNIYDYIGEHQSDFKDVYSALTDPSINKRTFSESASTPGGMNSNGQMVYIDSVYYYTNELLDQSGAKIKNEDSLYVAVIPQNAAYEEAKEKLEKLFKYSNRYKYNYTGGGTLSSAFTSVYTTDKTDSLKEYNAKKMLMTSMYFTPSIFGGRFPAGSSRDKKAEIADFAMHADSLISTNGLIFYNPNKGGLNPLFGDGNWVEASNGIIFPLTSYQADPANTIMQSQTLDMTSSYNVGDVVVGGTNGSKGSYYYLVDGTNWNKDIDISMLETKGYRYFQIDKSVREALDVYIPLRNLYSGKYRIRIQMLPNRVDVNHMYLVENEETHEQEELPDQKTTFVATLFDDEGKQIGSPSADIVVDDYAVKTYTLFESIEIPKCYYNLPSGVSNCFPLLKLEIPRPKRNNDPYRPLWNTQSSGLSITKIFIDPVRE